MSQKENCPLCGQSGFFSIQNGKDYFVFNGDSPSFSVLYCSDCLTGYTYPPLSDHELSDYYPEKFEAYNPKKGFAGRLQTYKYKEDIKRIRRNYKNKKAITIFEIGAGRGEFLYEAKKANCIVEGIEPGESGVEFAKNNYGIELHRGYASAINFKKKYDVIVLRHVLEHLNDFSSCLKVIHESGLNAGGSIYIKIPRMDSWESYIFGKFWHGYDLPRHRVHFSKAGIIKILNNLGYVNVKVKSEIVPNDIMRSVLYYSEHGKYALLRFTSKTFSLLPNILKTVLSQLIGIMLSPFCPGRMVVIANKKQE